jgi:hypothetical protein
MKSPFPGMDPYLEARWADVHVSLVGSIRESLQPRLPAGLRARSEERILVEDIESDTLAEYRSDVAVVRIPRAEAARPPVAEGGVAVAVPAPYIIEKYQSPIIDRFVKIIDARSGNKVVTMIEVLSPWNKAPGRANSDYRKKLRDHEAAGVNVVEIDLLRTSRGRLEITDTDLPRDRRTPYLICVQRSSQPTRWEAYAVPLRTPIPPIRVPLREGDADVVLELQPLIDRAYAAGGHDDIDYSKPPDPPLSAEDDAWADELLRKAGLR